MYKESVRKLLSEGKKITMWNPFNNKETKTKQCVNILKFNINYVLVLSDYQKHFMNKWHSERQ